ncbi:MAG: peptidylprolyl isomerase [Candidatus Neomarinimicrobiota bacterium]
MILNSCNKNDSIEILIDTELGLIFLELYPKKAPLTVENFLRYIDENRYEDFHFYRTVHLQNQPGNDIKIEVIQGGLGFTKHPKMLQPIPHETTKITTIKHLDGTISMARINPGTASSEIFICINNQPNLDFNGKRNPDKQGFAAFGRVTSGMEVVKKIQIQPSKEQILNQIVKVNSITRK